MLSIEYFYEDGSPTYSEQSSDYVLIWDGEDYITRLNRYESTGRFVDSAPDMVGPETPLWRDVDTWILHNYKQAADYRN
jgi:hypothetical protein